MCIIDYNRFSRVYDVGIYNMMNNDIMGRRPGQDDSSGGKFRRHYPYIFI